MTIKHTVETPEYFTLDQLEEFVREARSVHMSGTNTVTVVVRSIVTGTSMPRFAYKLRLGGS